MKSDEEIQTIDRSTDRKDPDEIAGIAMRAFVVQKAMILPIFAEQRCRYERERKVIPEGKCLKCKSDIDSEVLALNPKAPNCRSCNLLDLARKTRLLSWQRATLVTK